MKKASVYSVNKLKQPMKIDGNWHKDQWKIIKDIGIKNFMGRVPHFWPSVQAKMMYNDENLFIIYRVKDCYFNYTVQNYNGPVSNDSCVEFFFSPDINFPEKYFNLEVNCGGTPLMRYNIIPRKDYKTLEIDDIKKIEIAHSLPSKNDQEVTEPMDWTIEYRIPFSLLEKFSNITHPKPGINWRANFYKIAAEGSNPHWITWSFVGAIKPDFHLPQFFGILKFK